MLPMNWRITPRLPPREIVPLCAGRSPASSRMSVVFPAPFGPIRAAFTALPTRKETSSSSVRPSGRT